MFDEFFAKADELKSAGVPFVTATVVWAEKPTSGKPGDRAIVTADGTMYGWIGGSCAQPTVIREAVRAIADGRARLVRLSQEPSSGTGLRDVVDVPMTCYSGGTLEIFIEPHPPAPLLLVVGKLPVARALAHLGRAMSYRVIAVDPEGGEAMAHADEQLTTLADIPDRVTPLTFAVVATHGEYDEPALEALLGTKVPYIGLVASRARGRAVLDGLVAGGVDRTELERVRFPAGLDIGAQRGDEIAVSIIAEIVQARRALGEIRWDEESGVPVEASGASPETSGAPVEASGASAEAAGARSEPSEPQVAVDPVCGMEVRVQETSPSQEHEDRTYYFCCSGCASRFAADPAAFL